MTATTPLDEITKVAADLRDVLAEIERLSVEVDGRPPTVDRRTGEVTPAVTGASERFKRKRLEAFQATTIRNGRKWTVDQHNAYADMESLEEWAVFNALSAELRVAKERAHSYRQILSSLQTAARVAADLAR